MKNNQDDETAKFSIFKKMLKKLAQFRGKGTELISVYIPPKADRSSVMGQLTEEINQSANIKSSQTRKNVQGALRKITNYLRTIDFKLPATGLVVFCGNVSESEGKTDIKLFRVVPVKELKTKMYWCDSQFHLDPLQDMLVPNDVYGMIAMDKKEATIAILSGKRYVIIDHMTSQVPGKIRAGGQSAHRFERLREGAEKDFYRQVSERFGESLLRYGDKLKGVIIAGPGATKNYFMEEGNVDARIKNKILAMLDVSYTDEFGIREIVQKSEDVLKDTEMAKERKLVSKFIEAIAKDGLVTYGEKQVLEALDKGQAEMILVSDTITWIVIKYECLDCHSIGEKVVKDPAAFKESELKCESCQSQNIEVLEDIEYVEWIIEKAENKSTRVEVISTDTSEGEQFYKGFFGIGAFLRYR